jgi:hypothetical protein
MPAPPVPIIGLAKQIIDFIVAAVCSVGQLSTSWVRSRLDQIQEICGLRELLKLLEIAEITLEQLCILAKILEDLRFYFQCRNWYPLYATTV